MWILNLYGHVAEISIVFSIVGCEFPQQWQGEWNLEGDRESLDISVEDFGTKGFCLKHEDDIYVIYKRYVPRIYKSS